ncbi:proline-specific peptidase [Xylariaceae sp. FL0255]|nr:proline-specific peptidase [Xylariaceae sp. FL0255]
MQVREGKIPFSTPSVEQPCYTFYKIIGNLSTGALPVVILHGGPGAGHEYLLPFASLWHRYGHPVVFYDQIGCGSSTHLPERVGDKRFWQEQLFQDELDNILDHLRLREGIGFHLLGQSWGGMLAAAFTARQPKGLHRVVVASALASKELGARGTHLLREQMPSEMRRGLDEAEKRHENFVCRADPFPPPELLPSLKNVSEDPTVYRTMNGPSPLTLDGSLKTWTVISRLSAITSPVLVYNGECDTSHDVAQVPFFNLIPRVRWITSSGAGHMCHLAKNELRQTVLEVVGRFLSHDDCP